MSTEKYILDDAGNPVAEPDLLKWARWFDAAARNVAQTQTGNAHISTVFLGMNHNFGRGIPILWETMVFGGLLDQEQDRCGGSREQAEAMHAQMVARVEISQGRR